jgi:hypothetical protein
MKAVKVMLPYLAGVLIGVIVSVPMTGCASKPKSEKLPAPVLVSGGATSSVSKASSVPSAAKPGEKVVFPSKK